MKKALVILVVLAMAAPLYADTITLSAGVDPGTIEYAATGAIAPVAMALDVDADGTITDVAVDSFFDIFMDAAHDEEVAVPDSYVYGAGTPIANQDTVGEAVLPLAEFCISMGGLGGEAEPLDPAPMSGVITLTAGTATQATITANALRGGIVGTDGVEMTVTGLPLVVEFVTECFDSGHADYQEWLDAGSPECWCNKYHCYGDVDGLDEGSVKKGYYWVSYADLAAVTGSWKDAAGDTNISGDYPTAPGAICADVDRTEEGSVKKGYYRVSYGDLSLVTGNWKDTTGDTTAKGDDPYAHTCGGEL